MDAITTTRHKDVTPLEGDTGAPLPHEVAAVIRPSSMTRVIWRLPDERRSSVPAPAEGLVNGRR